MSAVSSVTTPHLSIMDVDVDEEGSPTPVYIGVDPGLTGAIAFLRWADDHKTVLCERVLDLPTEDSGGKATVKRRIDAGALANMIDDVLDEQETYAVGVVERVSAMPGQGVGSVFSLGDSFGAIRSTLAILDIPCELAHPVKWKREVGIGSEEGDEKGAMKKRSLALARARFTADPKTLALEKHHNRAEALLLAQWLYLREQN